MLRKCRKKIPPKLVQINLSRNKMALITFVVNFATRWRYLASLPLVPILATRERYLNWLPMWPPDCTTRISCKFGQQLALLELPTSWPPSGATWISFNFGHQMAPLTLPIDIISWYLVAILISQSQISKVCKTSCSQWRTDIRTHRSDPRGTWVR